VVLDPVCARARHESAEPLDELAIETVSTLVADFVDVSAEPDLDWERATLAFLSERVDRLFTGVDWEVLNAREIAAGTAMGKPREKVTSIREMLDVSSP
jgi:hypothetical protein